jgi:hypothetical protein
VGVVGHIKVINKELKYSENGVLWVNENGA